MPGVDDVIENFLAPSFADSRYADAAPSTGAEWVGLLIGAVISLGGIATAYHFYVRRRGRP